MPTMQAARDADMTDQAQVNGTHTSSRFSTAVLRIELGVTIPTRIMSQATAAHNLLLAIRQRIVDGKGPILGYAAAATAAGYTVNARDAGRAMGQVTSRIDLAAFYAGLPMLAVQWVRNPDGKVNPASFSDAWAQYKEQMESVAASHVWSVEDIAKVLAKMHSALDANKGAVTLWRYVESRRLDTPGYVEHYLHCALRS